MRPCRLSSQRLLLLFGLGGRRRRFDLVLASPFVRSFVFFSIFSDQKRIRSMCGAAMRNGRCGRTLGTKKKKKFYISRFAFLILRRFFFLSFFFVVVVVVVVVNSRCGGAAIRCRFFFFWRGFESKPPPRYLSNLSLFLSLYLSRSPP